MRSQRLVELSTMSNDCTTLLLSIGTHPKVVQELLGHGSIGITMDTYSHVMPTMQKNVMARLDDILGGVSQQKRDGNEQVAGGLEGKG
jgi:hypothetical protein